MKKTSKKIAGGILVVMLIGTIGAVVASAHPGFLSELTDEQKEEIYDLKQELLDAGASHEEIKEAMREQLEEYGVELPTREEMLDKRIEQTEQKLEILKRTKELIQENPEITKEEIREIIEEEFGIEMPDCEGMKPRHGFQKGFCRGPKGFMSDEEPEQ
jgi:hypothetical protein